MSFTLKSREIVFQYQLAIRKGQKKLAPGNKEDIKHNLLQSENLTLMEITGCHRFAYLRRTVPPFHH